MEESRVLLDGRDITDKLEGLSYTTRLGKYTVRIKTALYLDYCENIVLKKDGEVVVEPEYKISPAVYGKRNARIGYPTLGAGLLFLAGGLVINNDYVATALSSDYEGYVALKWTGLTVGCVGLVTATVGTVFIVLSRGDYKKAKKETEIWKPVRFSLDLLDSHPVFMVHIPLKN